MVAPVEFAVPPPNTGAFTNGELALGPSASPVAGLTTYYLARWFVLKSGIYTIKSLVDDAASWQLNAGITSLGATTYANGVFSRQIFVPEDVERFDITLRNMSTIPSLCFAAFSLWYNGALIYASKAEAWVIKTTPISDADLGPPPDVRLSLPVWSVFPNWQNGITERLEWLSDVLVSETQVEQRRSLRPEPRRSMEAGFMRKGPDRTRMDDFFAAIGQDRFTLPLFFEQCRVAMPVAVGAPVVFVPAGSIGERDFAQFDVCMLSAGDARVYELVQIASMNDTTGAVNLVNPTTRAWPLGSRLIPCRVARLMDAPQFSNRTDDVGVGTVRFSVDLPDQVMTPDWITPNHIFPFRIDYSQNIDETYSRLTVVLDNQVAAPMVFDYGRRARIGLKVGCQFFNRSDVKVMRQFLGMTRGRTQRFWMPTFTKDIEPVSPLVGTTIEAKPSGFPQAFVSPQEARTFIALSFNDDTPTIYRRLTGAFAGVDKDIYGIDTAWPAVDMAKVKRIGFMMPSRFDQDGFELLHRTDEARAVTVNFITMSTDSTGMPSL